MDQFQIETWSGLGLARQNVGKTHPTLGKCVANIPAREYFRLVAKYGKDTVLSPEFLRYFNKKHKDLSPNKIWF